MADTVPTPLARALGRIPTGLYIVSSVDGAEPVGFVGSFVMQVGLEPPTVCVAVGKARGPLEAMRAHGRFGVSVLDAESHWVMRNFFRKPAEGGSSFDGLELVEAPGGTPVLGAALAWVECRITGEYETGDHVVLFGEVEDGSQTREGDPSVHLRKDGLGY
jgi:flavin reductase (DIM6/NTAB) family NADH-FMN oxidoreductase RutF